MGYSPWGSKELDMTAHLSTHNRFLTLQILNFLRPTILVHIQSITKRERISFTYSSIHSPFLTGKVSFNILG